MIAIQEEYDSDIVTVWLSGVVTRADAKGANARLELLIEERDWLRLYVDVVGLARFESAGLWQGAACALRHRDEIERAAFLVDSPGEQWAGWLAYLVAGDGRRRFALGEEQAASDWLSERRSAEVEVMPNGSDLNPQIRHLFGEADW